MAALCTTCSMRSSVPTCAKPLTLLAQPGAAGQAMSDTVNVIDLILSDDAGDSPYPPMSDFSA